MKLFKKTAIALAAAQLSLLASGAAMAQTAGTQDDAGAATHTVVVTGQRRALENAQTLKKDADEIVDSIVADEAGKLPDRSIAEVLQRVVGVTIDRVGNKGDPQHFSVEGTGVTVRGLSYVRSELNGRDAFSSNGGRALSWADVPPELMAGVDVYKNPSAEQIEGGIAGLVNLRTAMPFDHKGLYGSISVKETRGKLRGATAPDASGLVSNRWDTRFGQVGALIDIAHSENKTRSDGIQAAPYFPRFDIVPGKELWVPQNGAWRREDYDHSRDGLYGALQWKSGAWDSSLSYFQSEHRSKWVEAAQWSDNDPYKSVFTDATYSDKGVFEAGTITNPGNGGVQFYNNTKVQSQKTKTKDLSWALQWRGERWSLKSDLQLVRATSETQTASVDLGAKLPDMFLDVRGSTPQIGFDAAGRAAMVDPANNYWNSMSYDRGRGDAKQTAWRGDAQYSFDDPILRDLRFGARLTEREATTRDTFNWAGITPAWGAGDQSWQSISSVASLADPRFAQPITPVVFTNFFNGAANVPPSLLVPTPSAMANYAPTYDKLASYANMVCKDPVKGCSFGYVPFTDALLNDPANSNHQREQTRATYATLRFGFDDWHFPVEGNVGVRVVQTHMKASGYLTLTPATGAVPPGVPAMSKVAEPRDYSQTYTNVLPSLNLKMNTSKEMQFRFAYSQGVSRPDFSQLQAYEQLSQNVQTDPSNGGGSPVLRGITYSGTAKGNPLLKPTRGTNFDITAEWYPSRSSSITLAVFNKKLKDIIVQQTYLRTLNDDAGQAHNFVVTGPTNGAKGDVKGAELGFQTYFDMLPGWLSGFGVNGNYTYISSTYSLYNRITSKYCSSMAPDSASNFDAQINGCDTDGRAIGDLPMPYLSKNAFNLALLYDRGPVSARVAYSWRGRYLQAVNANGYRGGNGTNTNPDSPGYLKDTNIGYSLPVWAEGYGTVDGSISYKVGENLTFALEGQNLTNKVFKQTVQQHVDQRGIMWFATGPRYTASLRYSF